MQGSTSGPKVGDDCERLLADMKGYEALSYHCLPSAVQDAVKVSDLLGSPTPLDEVLHQHFLSSGEMITCQAGISWESRTIVLLIPMCDNGAVAFERQRAETDLDSSHVIVLGCHCT